MKLSGFPNSQQFYINIGLIALVIRLVIIRRLSILTVDLMLGNVHTHKNYYRGSFYRQVLLSTFFMAVDYLTNPSLYTQK